MTGPLKVLIVEDNERDAALLLHELRRGGYEPEAARVDTPEAMQAALENRLWDVILSDYSMPRFSALAALAVLKEKALDLPFIIVSGTVGEDTAVAAMRAGAHDFMPKDALARLLPAIDRELRDVAVRAERKKMQEQLLMSERMASVGLLAASVAHEINNPLTVLAANLEFIANNLIALANEASATEMQPGAGSDFPARLITRLLEAREPLRDAQEASERVRQIVRDLKIFSRSEDADHRGPVDLHGVLESSIRMASNEIRHRARLVRDYRQVPSVEGNEARLGQVFLNLIVNAAQAIPEGRAAANEIRIATRLAAADRVLIEISDTGTGIAAEALPHIFDAFFTTKPAGVGSGLGLAICHRIVVAQGGEISVESQPGRGTLFRVALPCARSAAAAVGAVEAATAARRARILVVDDEPMLCTVIRRILGHEHEVTAVMSAEQALALINGGECFDIILSDLMMPEMTGMDLHAELMRSAPALASKMIFMTGGAFSHEAAAFLNTIPNPPIEKPFKAAALRQAIHTLML
jgi:signal transduction histidine kinase